MTASRPATSRSQAALSAAPGRGGSSSSGGSSELDQAPAGDQAPAAAAKKDPNEIVEIRARATFYAAPGATAYPPGSIVKVTRAEAEQFKALNVAQDPDDRTPIPGVDVVGGVSGSPISNAPADPAAE